MSGPGINAPNQHAAQPLPVGPPPESVTPANITPANVAPAPTVASSSAGSPVDDALDHLEAAQAASVATIGRAAEHALVTSELVSVYLNQGVGAAGDWLSNQPGALAALSHLSSEELSAGLVAEFGEQRPGMLNAPANWLGRQALEQMVENRMENAVRFSIFHQAEESIGASRESLEAMLADVPATVERLLSAPEGSPDAAMAERLGVCGDEGDEGDAARVREGVGAALALVEEFESYIQSPTLWDGNRFPMGALRAATELGYGVPAPGTLGASATFPDGIDSQELAQLVFRESVVLVAGRASGGIGSGSTRKLVDAGLDLLNGELAVRHDRMELVGRDLGL